MMLFIFTMLLIYMIMILLMILNNLISMKMKNIMNKSTPIECGFTMSNKFNIPFSIQFYYISILFLIFDIEISLMMPMMQKMFFSLMNKWMIMYMIIIIILMIGLLMEWKNNYIKWF